jgi:hypothetical protein
MDWKTNLNTMGHCVNFYTLLKNFLWAILLNKNIYTTKIRKTISKRISNSKCELEIERAKRIFWLLFIFLSEFQSEAECLRVKAWSKFVYWGQVWCEICILIFFNFSWGKNSVKNCIWWVKEEYKFVYYSWNKTELL